MLIDSKFKEDHPLSTVNRIRNILFKAGIFTVEQWTDSGIKGCHSVRIEIAGSHIGQNGKGVTREFALASGYAELMERIQSNYFYVGALDDKMRAYGGFQYAWDEKEFAVKDFMRAYGKHLQPMANRLQKTNGQTDIKEVFEQCRYGDTLQQGMDFSAVPFQNLKTKESVYIPVPVLRDIYATNGTCAGNVRSEAIVQGLSEIIERNHNMQVLTKQITPPAVPDEFLKRFPVYSVIQDIQKDTKCKLIIKDCSLGTGFPVIAAALVSRDSHKYIVKFGAHPVFEIALERTLTEMFQGRSIAEAVDASVCCYNENATCSFDNRHNVLKNASGKYHYSFFKEASDIKFKAFEDRTCMNNSQLLKYCTDFFEERGYDIYIRDCGYLGFPTYQLIIPGFSEIYNYGLTRLKEKCSQKAAGDILCRLEDAKKEDLERVFRYFKFKENFSMENTLSFTLRQPLLLTPSQDTASFFYIELCIAVRLEKWKEAVYLAQILEHLCVKDHTFCQGMQEYARLMVYMNHNDEALAGIETFYPVEILEKIKSVLNWEKCAEEIAKYCRNLTFSDGKSSAYTVLWDTVKKLKDMQLVYAKEICHEGCNCTEV